MCRSVIAVRCGPVVRAATLHVDAPLRSGADSFSFILILVGHCSHYHYLRMPKMQNKLAIPKRRPPRCTDMFREVPVRFVLNAASRYYDRRTCRPLHAPLIASSALLLKNCNVGCPKKSLQAASYRASVLLATGGLPVLPLLAGADIQPRRDTSHC